MLLVEAFEEEGEGVGDKGQSSPDLYVGDDMRGIEPLVRGGEAHLLHGRVPYGIEEIADEPHVGIRGGKAPAELHEGAAGEVVLFLICIEGIAPPDIEAEGVEGLLVAQIVPLLKKAQAEKAGDAEVGAARRAVEHGILVLVPEEDGKDLDPEQMRP